MDYLVSVVITTFNRRELLFPLISSIIAQSYQPVEIVIIDDCSQENIAEKVKHKFNSIVVIRCRRRFGPAFARNLGVLKAKGKYILFLDSDIEIVDKELIKNMISVYKNHINGQIGGELFLHDGFCYGHGVAISFDGEGIGKTLLLNNISTQGMIKCDYIPTSNCLIERSKIFEIGGFDSYYVYPGEDKDFGYRLKKKGYINCFTMNTLAKHNISEIACCKTRFHNYYRNKMRFAIKHHGIYMLFISPVFDFMRFIIKLLGTLKIKLLFPQESGLQNNINKGRPRQQSGSLLIAYINAFFWNIKMLHNTLASRKKNNLTTESIGEFIKYANKVKLFEKVIFY